MTAAADDRPPGQREPLGVRAFALFWSASTIRAFGGTIAAVAFQVLIVNVLQATPEQIGMLSALGVVPYLFLGLIVGALMDRWRRQRTLVITTVGRAGVLAVVSVLLLTDTLTVWSLALVLLTLGVLTLFSDSAAQPLLPSLVSRAMLVPANARLGQSATAAETVGRALGGALITLLGAPLLFAVDAVANAVAAVLQARIRVPEQPGRSARIGGLGRDIAEGIRYTYRHRTLRPLALSVHLWFLGNSIAMTLFAVFVLRQLAVPSWGYGIALACAGIGGVVGAVVAPTLGYRLGAGGAILLGRCLAVVPWVMFALAPLTAGSALPLLLVCVCIAQLVWGFAMGVEDANDIGYRQSIAPDAIQGRMNSTIRTVNRVVFFVGALIAGFLATALGYPMTFGLAAGVFTISALVIALSPLRAARHNAAPAPDESGRAPR